MSTASDILDLAMKRGWTLTIAESCTGGLVAAALTDVAGSSNIFQRGFITYSNAAKTEMLGVLTTTLDQYGAVSEAVAAEMVTGARLQARADLAVAITGIAGPGGSENKPEGRVCFGIAAAGQTITQTVEFGAIGRQAVRNAAKDHALSLLLKHLR